MFDLLKEINETYKVMGGYKDDIFKANHSFGSVKHVSFGSTELIAVNVVDENSVKVGSLYFLNDCQTRYIKEGLTHNNLHELTGHLVEYGWLRRNLRLSSVSMKPQAFSTKGDGSKLVFDKGFMPARNIEVAYVQINYDYIHEAYTDTRSPMISISYRTTRGSDIEAKEIKERCKAILSQASSSVNSQLQEHMDHNERLANDYEAGQSNDHED